MLQTFRDGLANSGGDWILGPRFSAADVLLGTGAWYLAKFGLVQDEPVLKAYVERCERRPAFQRANALETL
jgi:glutathione S-transferase